METDPHAAMLEVYRRRSAYMMKPARAILATLALATFAACGGGSAGSAPPTASAESLSPCLAKAGATRTDRGFVATNFPSGGGVRIWSYSTAAFAKKMAEQGTQMGLVDPALMSQDANLLIQWDAPPTPTERAALAACLDER